MYIYPFRDSHKKVLVFLVCACQYFNTIVTPSLARVLNKMYSFNICTHYTNIAPDHE